jgi:hypothetical protein
VVICGYGSVLDRRWLEPLLGTYGNLGSFLARSGTGAAILSYRQYPQVQRGDESLDDMATAIGFVGRSCEAWGCGPVYVMGHSAGGHLGLPSSRELFGPDEVTLATHSTASYVKASHPRLLFIDSAGDERVCRDGFGEMKARLSKLGRPAAFNETILRMGRGAT